MESGSRDSYSTKEKAQEPAADDIHEVIASSTMATHEDQQIVFSEPIPTVILEQENAGEEQQVGMSEAKQIRILEPECTIVNVENMETLRSPEKHDSIPVTDTAGKVTAAEKREDFISNMRKTLAFLHYQEREVTEGAASRQPSLDASLSSREEDFYTMNIPILEEAPAGADVGKVKKKAQHLKFIKHVSARYSGLLAGAMGSSCLVASFFHKPWMRQTSHAELSLQGSINAVQCVRGQAVNCEVGFDDQLADGPLTIALFAFAAASLSMLFNLLLSSGVIASVRSFKKWRKVGLFLYVVACITAITTLMAYATIFSNLHGRKPVPKIKGQNTNTTSALLKMAKGQSIVVLEWGGKWMILSSVFFIAAALLQILIIRHGN